MLNSTRSAKPGQVDSKPALPDWHVADSAACATAVVKWGTGDLQPGAAPVGSMSPSVLDPGDRRLITEEPSSFCKRDN